MTTPPPTLTPNSPIRCRVDLRLAAHAQEGGQAIGDPLAGGPDRPLVRIGIAAGEVEAKRGQSGLGQQLGQARKGPQIVVIAAETVAKQGGRRLGRRPGQCQRALQFPAVGEEAKLPRFHGNSP